MSSSKISLQKEIDQLTLLQNEKQKKLISDNLENNIDQNKKILRSFYRNSQQFGVKAN